uniref:Putative LOC101890584 [Musca domestica] n=1 Tax=Lepeophtheirus salmonis TaxID=72036 RepID=A0A0K2VF76_LEPSM
MFSIKIFVFLIFLAISTSKGNPLGKSRIKATHVPPKKFDPLRTVKEFFILPNTYYDQPNHRHPYYDSSGTGRLLYGYGGQDLYKYSVYLPIEGYYR